MKVTLSNLGVLHQAELEVGDLTIICGSNNTGKTYITYALYGFLRTYARFLKLDVDDVQIDELLSKGVIRIDLREYAEKANALLERACKTYTRSFPSIFASQAKYFEGSRFNVSLNKEPSIESVYEHIIGTPKKGMISLMKEQSDPYLVISLLTEERKIDIPETTIADVIRRSIGEIIFGNSIPDVFISSAERTGAVIFQKELDFSRNRLLDQMASDKAVDPLKLLFQSYRTYAMPVKDNVDFTRNIGDFTKRNSFIAEKHNELLKDFNSLIGGQYEVRKKMNDELFYKPRGSQRKLTMGESSSSVRSLMDIGFYLKHLAKPGDMLMIDEPELNLHPENQRRLARLFVGLVNVGVKVFITTHSDYIVKELNTLIMLRNNREKDHVKQLIAEEGYKEIELLDQNRVKVYVAKKKLAAVEGSPRKKRRNVLVAAKITPEYGIEADSFDDTIDKMNAIQDRIMWGD